MKYAVLFHPGHNRVYFETALALSVSEFAIVSQKLSAACTDVCRESIQGVDYLTFQTERALTEADWRPVSALSFVYALFEVITMDGETVLKPLPRRRESFVDDGMSAMLKYTGKTNEIFTRMLINIAASSQDNTGRLRLLDPIAGKGTTLFEGLARGYDVYGIEIGDAVVNEAYHFVKRYLETARYKFDCASIKISGPNKSFTAQRHTFTAARTKEEMKAGGARTLELIAGNSAHAAVMHKKNFFNIIVGDLPYGVQHGNVTNEKQSAITRNPSQLLRACLPAWAAVLKPGGCMALSWNSNVLPRKQMEELLAAQGFEALNDDAYASLAHRVDQAIVRDVIAARKKA